MSEDDPNETSNGVDEDDWHLYASADYGAAESIENSESSKEEEIDLAVSYTHLTLPTNREV